MSETGYLVFLKIVAHHRAKQTSQHNAEPCLLNIGTPSTTLAQHCFTPRACCDVVIFGDPLDQHSLLPG